MLRQEAGLLCHSVQRRLQLIHLNSESLGCFVDLEFVNVWRIRPVALGWVCVSVQLITALGAIPLSAVAVGSSMPSCL